MACPSKPASLAGGGPPAAELDGNAVLATVAELASGRYAGRAAGSPGGALARAWLSGQLTQAGYAVSALGFDERVGVNRGQSLLVIEAGGVRREFRYREDFREAVRGGFEGQTARGPLVALEGLLGGLPPPGCILLIPAARYEPDGLWRWQEAGVAGVLVELPNGSPAMRPLWPGQPKGSLVRVRQGLAFLAVSSAAYAVLAEAAGKGALVEMESPVRFMDVRCENIVAAWNGDGGVFSPALAVMAHYDHVGADSDGSFFPGALDNASGAAMALELARLASRAGVKADLAVILTDAEEVGLSGAAALARNPPFALDGLTVLNLDMLGSVGDLELELYSNGDPAGLALSQELAEILIRAGFRVKPAYPVYNVDHSPLTERGAAAVTLCEYDQRLYHTKGDLPSGLSADELDRLGDALGSWLLGRLMAGPATP